MKRSRVCRLTSVCFLFSIVPAAVLCGSPSDGSEPSVQLQASQAQIYDRDLSPFPAPVGRTGQVSCYDRGGNLIDCAGTGQDGEYTTGVPWPSPRFTDNSDGTVTDNLTGLIWLRDAGCLFGTRLDVLAAANSLADGTCGLSDGSAPGDWHLANILELRSLMSHEHHDPALSDTSGVGQWSEGDPFLSVQQPYWSSTFDVDRYLGLYMMAWWSDLSDTLTLSRLMTTVASGWPNRGTGDGGSSPAPVGRTGQLVCTDAAGILISCAGTGQDGDTQAGVPWPSPRFRVNQNGTVVDNLTGLLWLRNPDCPELADATWPVALTRAAALSDGMCDLRDGSSPGDWRIPNMLELMSLVYYNEHGPALPNTAGDGKLTYGDPFYARTTSFWTSTTDMTYPAFAIVVKMLDGSAGTYSKADLHGIWAVRDATIFLDGFESGDTSAW